MKRQSQDIVGLAELNSCPENVSRYLRKAGVVGHQRISFAHYVHAGEFRLKPTQKWMAIKGDYKFSPQKPCFVWKASIRVFPLIFISVVDGYDGGVGRNQVKLESLFTIGDSKGPEVNESSLGRLLSEFVLMPTALVPSQNLRWESIDLNSSRAVFEDNNMQAVATFDFDEDQLPWKITVDRFGNFEGKVEKRPFVVRLSKFQNFDGVLLPTDIIGSWLMPEGEFTWLHFTMSSAELH